MIYVIFNQDGSIKSKFINEYIQQGDDSSTAVFFAIDGATESEYEYSVFARLPNNQVISVLVESDREEIINGVKYIGCYFTLDSDITLIEGVLQLNLIAKKDNTTKVTYNLYLTINQTDLPIDAPITITRQEYESLIESISSFSGGTQLYLHHIVATETNGGDAVDLYFITNSQTHLTIWDIREPDKFIKGWFTYGDTPFTILGGNNNSEGGLVLIDNDNATVDHGTSYLFEWDSSSTYEVTQL
jgi:hypothetical protein